MAIFVVLHSDLSFSSSTSKAYSLLLDRRRGNMCPMYTCTVKPVLKGHLFLVLS